MDLLVAHDLTAHGDAALRAALDVAARESTFSIGVVHVVTQHALDKTGGLSAEEKQRAAVEALYPAIWKRVDAIVREARGELEDWDIDVVVRVAAAHLARAEARVAETLSNTAKDYGVARIVIGRKGRPDSVAEHLAKSARLTPIEGHGGVLLAVR